MFHLFRSMTVGQLLVRQAPVLAVSLVIAEVFYKFHSFTLECGAFLATWFVLDAVAQFVRPWRSGAGPEAPRDTVAP
jgi:hypothetical protein